MKPYVVLGTYRPTRWRAWKIGRDLTNFTRTLGLTPLNDSKQQTQVRAPWYSVETQAEVRKRTVRNPKAAGWHKDGDLDHGSNMDHALVLWANRTPVEFRGQDGTVYQPAPYEVVLVRNLDCSHRRPPDAPRLRWRFRQKIRHDNVVIDIIENDWGNFPRRILSKGISKTKA